MNELRKKIRNIQDKFYLIKKDRERQVEKLNKLEKDREDTIHNIDVRVETINFIEGVAAQERVSVKEKVEKLITDCLHEVYDDSYSVSKYVGNDADIIVPNQIDGKRITAISNCAFQGNPNVVNLTVAEGISNIGSNTFENCKNLTTVNLPESLTVISGNAFRRCKKLKKVVILAKTRILIIKDAFEDCKELKIYTIKGSGAEKYANRNNIPVDFV